MSWQLRRRGIIYFLNDIEKFLSIHTEIMFIKAVLLFRVMKKCCRRIPQLVGCSHEISDKFLTKRKIGDINGRSSLMYRQFHPVKCVDTVIPNVADFLAHRLE